VTAISAVVCTYSSERRDQVREAVESLRGQTVPPLEIVVVVDHQPALLRDLCRSLPGAAVRESRRTPGLSGCRNEGLAACAGELVAFLDDDAVAAPDWLATLLRRLSEPAVMGAGGHAALRWELGRPAWFPHEFDWVVGGSYRGQPGAAADVRNVLGSNMAFRAALVREVGGFREGVGRVGTRPTGCEETELCIRLRQRWPEGRIVYDPAARIVHRVPATRARVGYYVARCYAEGVSKAQVAALVGGRDATASERRHAARTLPAGIVREVVHGVRDRSPAGLLRGAAIVGGLAAVAGGFLAERAWRRVSASR
jgi:GT2 family glycosyltransferase